MIKQEQVTLHGTLLQFLPGSAPPQIVIEVRTVGKTGAVRHLTRHLPVPDLDLFQRLCAQVREGDEITATVVTEWSSSDYRHYLADFAPAATQSAAIPSGIAVK